MLSIKKYRSKLGFRGESAAVDYLEKKGFKIIEHNFRCRGGEIDLIASKGEEIHFVEVKTRTTSFYGAPEEAVSYAKRLRMTRAAQFCLLSRPQWATRAHLFSVVAISYLGDTVKIELFENAFELEGDYY